MPIAEPSSFSVASPGAAFTTTMKTAVCRILRGKERDFNRRFEELASHYLFDAGGLYAGRGLGERSGGEPGAHGPTAIVHAHAQSREPR